MDPARAARLKLVGAAVLFSTGGAAIKATSIGGWQVAGLRSGIAALSLALFLPEARRGFTARAAAAAVAYAATLILFVTANKLTTAASTIFLQDTAPLYLLVLGPLLLREPLRRRDLALAALVALGLALFFAGAGPPARTAPAPLRGNALAALSGLAWALTLLGLRWVGAGGGSPLAAVVLGNAFAFAGCLPWALPFSGVALSDWAVLAYLGVVQIGVAYLLVAAAIRHVPAFEASLLLLVEPALNPVWAFLVHGERPGGWVMLGGALVLGATAAKAWLEARPAPGAAAAPQI